MQHREDSRNEDPLESDQDSHDDSEFVDCPYCGKSIAEDAEVCPHCKSYIIPLDSHRTVPRWVMATIWLLLAGGAIVVVMAVMHLAQK